MQLSTEYLVVGAGTAGSAFGWLMRQAGHDVLVLELRDAQTKDKLCGGILGDLSLHELDAIYGPGTVDELGPTFTPHLRYRSLDREIIQTPGYATIERKRLDDWVLTRYLDAGGALRDRIRLVGIDMERHVATCVDQRSHEHLELTYGTLVGADGATSAVRRLSTGRRQRVVASCQGNVALGSEDIIFSHQLFVPGYSWYIPTEQGACVGSSSFNTATLPCRAWLAAFCKSLGIELPALRGAPIPTGDDVLLKAGTDIWLLGDAAGLVRATDGGGIHYALLSAHALADALTGGEPYESAMVPVTSHLAKNATMRDSYFTQLNVNIIKTGSPIEP